MMQCNSCAESDTLPDDITAFDVWLRESLFATYGKAMCDPVPEEMLAVLVAAFDPLAASCLKKVKVILATDQNSPVISPC